MEIMKVLGRMVCTQRVAGLGHMNLRILENNKGKKLVAVDPVGARDCLLYTSPSPRDPKSSRMPSSA